MLFIELLMELELPLGQFLFAQMYVSLAEPEMGVGDIRGEFKRLLILRHGLSILAALGVKVRKLEMGIRQRRVERDGFL